MSMRRRSSRQNLDAPASSSSRDSAKALGRTTSRRRTRDERDSASSSSTSGSRRTAVAVDVDDDDAAKPGFFAPVPDLNMRAKHARTLGASVRAAQTAKLSAMNEELRSGKQAELTRYLLFKGTVRAEPIDRTQIKKECCWVGDSAAKDLPLDAMLAQSQRSLRGLGLDLKSLPVEMDKVLFPDGKSGGKYGKKFLFVTQRLDRAESGLSPWPKPSAGPSTSSSSAAAAASSSAAAAAAASSSSPAASSTDSKAEYERGLLLTVLALLYVGGGCGTTAESLSTPMLESELVLQLAKLDGRIRMEPGYRNDPLTEAGASLPELLAAFSKQLFLVKGTANADGAGEQDKQNNYRLGPRFFLEVGERQLYRFCCTLLGQKEDDGQLAGIAKREATYEAAATDEAAEE